MLSNVNLGHHTGTCHLSLSLFLALTVLDSEFFPRGTEEATQQSPKLQNRVQCLGNLQTASPGHLAALVLVGLPAILVTTASGCKISGCHSLCLGRANYWAELEAQLTF